MAGAAGGWNCYEPMEGTVGGVCLGGKINGSALYVLNLRFLIRQLNGHVLWAVSYLSLRFRREV